MTKFANPANLENEIRTIAKDMTPSTERFVLGILQDAEAALERFQAQANALQKDERLRADYKAARLLELKAELRNRIEELKNSFQARLQAMQTLPSSLTPEPINDVQVLAARQDAESFLGVTPVADLPITLTRLAGEALELGLLPLADLLTSNWARLYLKHRGVPEHLVNSHLNMPEHVNLRERVIAARLPQEKRSALEGYFKDVKLLAEVAVYLPYYFREKQQ
ncbi:hypothetical protein [Meiothermus sp. CFH 77666]|uniref:hypothetical protein n=1 Tax=Meiothermus sp. CFH 77666 TaxID=2817942 RepID=UPI001AA01425|nr:hypothetical protein [Meiothermus sp. CFH 77666]MBO1436080.1 hypothetical protein [Meiothermus sp. CFH 77666]